MQWAPQMLSTLHAADCCMVASGATIAAQPACLATWPSSCAASATARHRLRTSAGVRRAATRSLATCAASKTASGQGDSVSQRQCLDAVEAAPKRTRSSNTPVRYVPWNAAAEAAVLQFWTEQGALLPAAEVQPEQQAEQRRLRSKVLWWAAKHPRHRDVDYLRHYMARVRIAAAASGWTDELWRIPLMEYRALAHKENPALLLLKVQAAVPELATHGVRLSHAAILAVQLRSSPGAADVARLQLALDSLPVSLDCLHVLQIAPTLLNMSDARSELGRRVAAMQLLHLQLDVQRVSAQPAHPAGFHR